MILCLTSVYLSLSLRAWDLTYCISFTNNTLYQVYSWFIIRCTHYVLLGVLIIYYQVYSWSISAILMVYHQLYSWSIIRCTHNLFSDVLILIMYTHDVLMIYNQVYSWCIIRCTHACSLPVCGPHALCSAALHRPVCACEDGYEGNPYDKCTKVTLAARCFSLSNISIRCRQELACDSDENDSGRYLYSNCN